MEKNLTTGSVWKTVLQFSMPYLLSYFLQTLYGMADLFIIGQFNGVESTTAVSIGSQVMHMLTVMIVGLAMGAIVRIGQAVGAKKKEQVSLAIGNTVTLFMALSAQNIGAGKHARARATLRYATVIAVVWGIGAVILMQRNAELFVSLFSDSARVTRLGGQYMRGYVWDCMLAGIHFSFSGYFCAYGLSGLSFLHNSLSIICVRIPLSFLASKYFTDTLLPMGLASSAGSALSVVICAGAFLWMERRRKRK